MSPDVAVALLVTGIFHKFEFKENLALPHY